MPAIAPLRAEPQLPKRKRNIINHDQQVLGNMRLGLGCQEGDRFTRKIHE